MPMLPTLAIVALLLLVGAVGFVYGGDYSEFLD